MKNSWFYWIRWIDRRREVITKRKIFDSDFEKEKEMNEIICYRIFLGYNDSQTKEQLVTEDELEQLVSAYFQKKKIGFTVSSGKGGYLYKDGKYILENIIIITLVGDQGIDIFRLAKNLSMYLNQEASLVMKHTVEKRYM